MEDVSPKYMFVGKHLRSHDDNPSHYSLASANRTIEHFPDIHATCPEKPRISRRGPSDYQRRLQAASFTKPIARPKLQSASCPACVLRYFRDVLRAWVLSQRKPYTAITQQIDQLTSEDYEEGDFGGIPGLVEVIRLQDSGPTEAARALRKKLKYGSPHRQLRALTLLDGLLQNGGSRFQRSFADEMLLERLRILPRDEMVDSEVRRKCNVLYRQWANAYKGKSGLEGIATLYTQVPKAKRPMDQSQSKVLRETERDAQRDISSPFGDPEEPAVIPSKPSPSPSSSSKAPQRPISLASTSVGSSSSLFKRDKRGKLKPFSVEKEKTQMLEAIAQSSVASTNLLNALKLINRENELVSENREVVNRFEQCKSLRRSILRYIQLVESEQWLGSLISANDELIKALMAFEIMDKSVEDDSDSDTEAMGAYETSKAEFQRQVHGLPSTKEQLAQLQLEEAPPSKPPRPSGLGMPPKPPASLLAKQRAAAEDEDEDDPFGDSHAAGTPQLEQQGMRWRDV